MKIEQTYIAKDGRKFDDPCECEEYEKTLGIEEGSIGDLLMKLEKYRAEDILSGVLLSIHDDKSITLLFDNVCVDEKLRPYLNVDNLDESQRWITNTVQDTIRSIKNTLSEDDPCQHIFVIRNKLHENDANVSSSYNPRFWEEMKRINNTVNLK